MNAFTRRILTSLRHAPALVCCTIVALALACSDAGGPSAVSPKQVVIAAGDSQSTSPGAPLAIPLAVRLIGSDNQPFPGAVVNWTVTQGVAVTDPPTSVTDTAGQATTAVAVGFQTGPVRVTASVAGIAPVVFSATAVSSFPCASITPFVFDVSGTLDAGDCTINGYYVDAIGLALPSQRSVSLHVASSTMDPWVGLYGGNGAFLAMNDDSLLTVAHNSVLNVILPAGGYVITPSAFGPATPGDYTLAVFDRPALLTGCDADSAFLGFMNPALHYTGSDRSAVWLTRGVSFSETITAADCVDSIGPFYSDRAFIWLDSSSVLTVREASTDFNPYLTLFGPNNFRAFNDDSAGATTTKTAYLVVQAPRSAAYLIDVGTRDTAATGTYTLSIARGP